jgi:uncharacterized protein (DUF58 family)
LGEKFTFARRLAAGIAMLALSVFDQVRLVGFAERIGPQLHAWQHPQKFAAVLEFLEGLGPRGQTDLLACARQYPPVDGAEMLLVISDLLCAQHLEQAIGLLRRRHQQVRVLHIIDACDADPDLAGQLRLEEVESGGAMAVEASPQLLQAYRCQWDGFCQAAHAACVGKGAEFDAIYTHDNWAQAALSAIE